MKEYKAHGHVNSESKLTIYDRELFVSALSSFQSTNVEVIVREYFNPFSDQYREYYFAVIVKEVQKAFKAVGVIKSQKETDYYLRSLFLYKEVYNEELGEWEKEPHTLRTGETEVSTQMMQEYCELCRIWAVQSLDWVIPFPNETLRIKDLSDRQKVFDNPVKETSF